MIHTVRDATRSLVNQSGMLSRVLSSFVGGLESGIGARRYTYSGPLLTIIP